MKRTGKEIDKLCKELTVIITEWAESVRLIFSSPLYNKVAEKIKKSVDKIK